MRAGVLLFGDENTLMLHFGTQEIMAMAQMIQSGDTQVLPAMSMLEMGEHFGDPVTHVQFVISRDDDTFNEYMGQLGSALGIEPHETGDYDPLAFGDES